MREGGHWRELAMKSVRDATAEIEAAAEPLVVVILTVGVADMFNERPVSIYANQSRNWLHRALAFAAWRTSLWEDKAEGPIPPTLDDYPATEAGRAALRSEEG